jgi:ketosteroid isomerase-like protein
MDFDPIAVAVDWLDACRRRDLDALLDLYADDACVDCACDSVTICGRSALEAYWQPRLNAFAPTAFGLEEIAPQGAGVVLHYSSHEGKQVKIVFSFADNGRIRQTRCGPYSA